MYMYNQMTAALSCAVRAVESTLSREMESMLPRSGDPTLLIKHACVMG